MSHQWAANTKFQKVGLEVEDRHCGICGRFMHVHGRKTRRIFTLNGPCLLVKQIVHCADRGCSGHGHTFGPQAESMISLPRWVMGWDVFAWVGHRRFGRHWSVTQIRAELADSYAVELSDDVIETSIRRYQTMLAARQQDMQKLRSEYEDVDELVLSIDGLQPEKGHETLYAVRELNKSRVWFAESLISSSTEEVGRLFVKAREWAQALGKPVRLWVSDKQDAFVKGVRAEFAGVPHRYCQNHFLRDVAKPVLALDSTAKVQMRRKVRGLRAIERAVLDERRAVSDERRAVPDERRAVPAQDQTEPSTDEQGQVVLDYCTAVRGILNDDQGGPLRPPGLRMAEALGETRASLQRNLDLKKGGRPRAN